MTGMFVFEDTEIALMKELTALVMCGAIPVDAAQEKAAKSIYKAIVEMN